MAAVIHSLWEKGDRNPLIQQADVPIDDPRVQFELTRYLSDNWVPILEKDVDGPSSLPLRLTARSRTSASSRPVGGWRAPSTLGRRPRQPLPTVGLEDRRVKLGCVMPGESPAVLVMRRGGWQPRRPTSTRTGRATGTQRNPPSPSWPKTAPSNCDAIRTRWCRSWRSACGPTCVPRATSGACIRSRDRVPTSPTTAMRVWWCWASTTPTAGSPGTRPRRRPRPSWRRGRHAAPVPQHARVPRRR